jgi:hypothetical protein
MPFSKGKSCGRPKTIVWSNNDVPKIDDIDYKVSLARVRQQNSHIEQCICIYCEEIIVGPILLPCEHGSCRSCFLKNNFKTPITGTPCVKCNTVITSATDIKASGLLQKLIDYLNVKCDQGRFSLDLDLSFILHTIRTFPFSQILDQFLRGLNETRQPANRQ